MHNKLYRKSFPTFINLIHKRNYTQIRMCVMHKVYMLHKLPLTSVLACPYMLDIPTRTPLHFEHSHPNALYIWNTLTRMLTSHTRAASCIYRQAKELQRLLPIIPHFQELVEHYLSPTLPCFQDMVEHYLTPIIPCFQDIVARPAPKLCSHVLPPMKLPLSPFSGCLLASPSCQFLLRQLLT